MSVPYEQPPPDLQARVRAIDPDARPAPRDRSHRRETSDTGGTWTCEECDPAPRFGTEAAATKHVIGEHGGGRLRWHDKETQQ